MLRSIGVPHRLWKLLLAVALVAGTVAGAEPAPVRAEVQGGRVTVELVHQRVWLSGPRASLGLRLRITNSSSEALEGFRLALVVGDRVESRSALHDTFENPDSVLLASAFSHRFPTKRIAAGQSDDVFIRDSVEALVSLAGADEGGVYPLAIYLSRQEGEELDATTTELIYYPREPVDGLNLVLVVPLSAVPARGPDGTFAKDPLLETWPLEAALARVGWLRGTLTALRGHSDVDLGLAPTPRLLEEIADMSDGYVRSDDGARDVVSRADPPAQHAATWLTQIQDLLARRNVQLLRVPYAAPDLVALNQNGRPSPEVAISDQLAEGRGVLEDVLGADLATASDDSWVFVPGGRFDVATLEALQRFALASPSGQHFKTFIAPESVDEPNDPAAAACPRSMLTFSCPVVVQGPTRGFISDGALADRFDALARPGDEIVDLQRLLAETAMIREEIPGVSGRVVQVTVPAPWQPSPEVIEELVRGISEAPWIETRTPEAGLRVAARPARLSVVEEPDQLRSAPARDLYGAVADAESTVDNLAAIKPDPALLERLERNLLVAQSRLLWGDPGLQARAQDFATESQAEADRQLSNIRIGGRGEITLTSRRQSIPLVLFNNNPYPVRVEVHLDSPALDFDRRIIKRREVQQGNNPFVVQATALSSGVSYLGVSLYPLGGGDQIASTQIVVRSTQFNRIALGITIGALAFLILFYALRGVRNPRGHVPPRGATRA